VGPNIGKEGRNPKQLDVSSYENERLTMVLASGYLAVELELAEDTRGPYSGAVCG
jgi:hypothetical protein